MYSFDQKKSSPIGGCSIELSSMSFEVFGSSFFESGFYDSDIIEINCDESLLKLRIELKLEFIFGDLTPFSASTNRRQYFFGKTSEKYTRYLNAVIVL